MSDETHLPNAISLLRVAGSIGLLFCDVAGWLFWALYALCGISDMVDGWLARNIHAESKTGAVLDSVADIVFVACCAFRLLPVLEIPVWLWIWAGVIIFIKIVSQISALVVRKRFCFPHTLANKLTGFLLFLTVPTMFWSMVPISIVAALAMFAAVQEGHLIRKKSIAKMAVRAYLCKYNENPERCPSILRKNTRSSISRRQNRLS